MIQIRPVIATEIRHCLLRRFPRQFSYVQARLSRDGVYGLHFTFGCVVFVAAAWLFGGIAEDLIMGDPLILVDALISQWFQSHATPRLAGTMYFASALGSTTAVCILFALMGCVLSWQRHWYRLLGLVSAVAGGMLLNLMLKHLFDRARPGWADPLLALTDPGFPSGHTMMATIIYGFIAVHFIRGVASWRWRCVIAASTILLILLVALSRMYLGAHYLSDVLAAMAAGCAWIALCLTAAETMRRRHNAPPTDG
jgi:undecaprenyl-diphosphatase